MLMKSFYMFKFWVTVGPKSILRIASKSYLKFIWLQFFGVDLINIYIISIKQDC